MEEDMACSVAAAGTVIARRGGRIPLEVPIIILGSDTEGRYFSEQTHTVVLSRFGAGIVSRAKLIPEQELTLRAVAANREVEVRVVGEIGRQGELHTYGVAFVNGREDFWHMEFPSLPSSQDGPATLALECSGCQDLVELENGEYEYDICAIHGGLARFCDECGLLTVWRQSTDLLSARPRRMAKVRAVDREVRPDARETLVATPRVEPNLVPLAETTESSERRSRRRAKVNFFACIRTESFLEEVVQCIDMSRGGVSFRSRNSYEKGMRLEIAVPYAAEVKEAPAIFVRGRIAHVRDRGKGEMPKYGVEFQRN